MTRPTDPGRSAHCFEALPDRDAFALPWLSFLGIVAALMLAFIGGMIAHALASASHDAALVHAYGSDAGAMMEYAR